MSGTKARGIKASATNKARHGESFYQRIGARGGVKGAKDGVVECFAANLEVASWAGRKGGLKTQSKRANKAYNKGTTWNAKANSASSASSTNTSRVCDFCKHPYKAPGIVKGHCSNCAPDFHDDELNALTVALIEEKQPRTRWFWKT